MPSLQNDQVVKILLVDDEEMGRQVMQAMLENIGIQVRTAQNGAEAVKMVTEHDFDLVLMDIQMPIMDGLSAVKAMRNLAKIDIDQLPIIALTGNSFTTQQENIAAGFSGYVAKPIEFELLYAEICRCLPGKVQPNIDSLSPIAEHGDLSKALPQVDVADGLRRLGGDRQLYIEMLGKFVKQFTTFKTELITNLQTNKQQDAIRLVHTLKSVAGGLGAKSLCNLTGQLEAQLTLQQEPTAYNDTIVSYQQLLAAINLLPQLNYKQQTADLDTGTVSELHKLCQQIYQPLKDLQVQLVQQYWAQIQEKKWPQQYADKLSQLDQYIETYQFNPAAELVDNLKGALKKAECNSNPRQ